MGEIADMMLDGTLCQGCGEFMDGDGLGLPRYCHGCKPHAPSGLFARKARKAKTEHARCPVCRKWVKAAGLKDHTRDKHGEPAKC